MQKFERDVPTASRKAENIDNVDGNVASSSEETTKRTRKDAKKAAVKPSLGAEHDTKGEWTAPVCAQVL